jgi:alkylhydroperoxidase family enzyme
LDQQEGSIMRVKSVVLVLVGVVIGVAIGPVAARLGAQKQQYVRLTTPRIPAVEAQKMTPEQKAIRGNANIAVVLNDPVLAKHWWDWLTFMYDIQGTRGDSALKLRDKELLLLRTSYLNHDDWLWGMHTPMAKDAGRTAEEIARIPKGPNATGWDDKDKALLMAADELHADSFISDATWKKLSSYYNQNQMLDIVFFVGTYATNAYYANSTGLPYAQGRATPVPKE